MKKLFTLFVALALTYGTAGQSWSFRNPAFVAQLAPKPASGGGGGADFLTDLAAYYALDDATDTHTYSYDLTEAGTATYVAGMSGNGFDAAAGPGYLTESSAFDFNAKSYTVSLWFRSPDPTVSQTLWAWEGFGGITLRVSTTATLFHYDGGWQSVGDATSFSADTWYHVVCRYDADADELSIFVNGTKSTTSAIGSAAASASPIFYLGDEGWGNQSNSVLDEVAIWLDRALSDGDVDALWNAGSGKFYGTF